MKDKNKSTRNKFPLVTLISHQQFVSVGICILDRIDGSIIHNGWLEGCLIIQLCPIIYLHPVILSNYIALRGFPPFFIISTKHCYLICRNLNKPRLGWNFYPHIWLNPYPLITMREIYIYPINQLPLLCKTPNFHYSIFQSTHLHPETRFIQTCYSFPFV